MKIPPRYRSIVFLFIASIILSAATPVIAKLIDIGKHHLINGRNPISFCNVLFAGNAVAFLVLFVLYFKNVVELKFKKIKLKNWLLCLIGAILSGFLYPSLFFLGIQFADVVNVVLITTLEIPIGLLIGRFFFRETMRVGMIIGAAIIVLGIALTGLLQEQQQHVAEYTSDIFIYVFLDRMPWAGEICVLLAVTIREISDFLSRYTIQTFSTGFYNVFRVSVGSLFFFVIVIGLFGWQHFTDLFSPFLWKWMLLYGGVIIGFKIYLRYIGLKYAKATELAISAAIVPIVAIFFTYLILGEPPNTAQWIGGSITMGGIVIALITKLTRKEEVILEEPVGFSGI